MTTLKLSGSIARPRTTAKKGYYQEKQDPFQERWEGGAGCLEIAFNSTAESLDPLSCLLLLVAVGQSYQGDRVAGAAGAAAFPFCPACCSSPTRTLPVLLFAC